MELIDNLALGFSVALTVSALAYCALGVTLGIVIGVLPGIGPLATVTITDATGRDRVFQTPERIED